MITPIANQPLPAVPALPRSVPTLTAYADGQLNFNSQSTALLLELGQEVMPLRPRPHRRNVGNPRRPNLWELSVGAGHRLLNHGDRITVCRCKAGKDAPPPGRYLLTPIAGKPTRFTLVPVAGAT